MAYTEIDDSSAYFQTTLYSGTGSSQSITNTGNSDLQPDFVWIKARSDAGGHALYDSVRGTTKRLASHNNAAEGTVSGGVTAFGADGFTVGNDGDVNSASSIVSWNWKKTADAGFDIVSYSGNNSTNRQISHSLSAKPDMMIVKCRQSGLWKIYHSSLGATKYLVLSDTAAAVDNNSTWNDTEPTSSNFTLGDDGNVNETGETYINYLFAEKKGYSKFGSYTGNGNADGTFVYLGFKPAFIITKYSSGTGQNWQMYDNKRNPHNFVDTVLFPNGNADEEAYDKYDFLSNGFKARSTSTGTNVSGGTYIYMAFAENPFVTSTGVPSTAR